MRKSFGSKILTAGALTEAAGGQIVGIDFGADFTSEHERGIRDLKEAFGVLGVTQRHEGAGDIVGLDARAITLVPSGLEFIEDMEGHAYLIYTDPAWSLDERRQWNAKDLDRILEVYDGEELSTAWDASSFGVRMKNDGLMLGATILGQIYEAIMKHDAVLFLAGGDMVFSNAGLVVAIRSRIPKEQADKVKEGDEDYLRLLASAEKTGIAEKLDKAGLGYFALSPRWLPKAKPDDESRFKTEYPVIFWLNPMNQQVNNYGWFTVEDLLAWIKGEGPIPMQKSEASHSA